MGGARLLGSPVGSVIIERVSRRGIRNGRRGNEREREREKYKPAEGRAAEMERETRGAIGWLEARRRRLLTPASSGPHGDKEPTVPGPRFAGTRHQEAKQTMVRAERGGRCVEADY